VTYSTIDGHPCARVEVHVPAVGPWWADVDCTEAPSLAGAVVLVVGALELRGTVDAGAAGTFGLQARARVVAGGGGWGSLLAAKAYHNDAGVSALLVAQDAAREAGEVLGAFSPAVARLGVDYVRQSGPASRVLEDVIGAGVEWWVGYDGATVVGARPEVAAPAGAYELVDADPRSRCALLAVDDLSLIGIGSILSERLDDAQTVRELVLDVTPDASRVRVWSGDTRGSRLAAALRSVVARASDRRLHGLWRYRVIRMAGVEDNTRVELQAMSRAAGLPDILPISSMMGIPGCTAFLTPGAEVIVQFLEGDRTLPRVTHYVGKGGPGFLPVELMIGSAGGAPFAARVGDPVRVTIPIGSFLIGATAGVLNPAPVDVTGTITGGSEIVGVG